MTTYEHWLTRFLICLVGVVIGPKEAFPILGAFVVICIIGMVISWIEENPS